MAGVLDSNVLISRLLVPISVVGRAVQKAVDIGQILISDAMLDKQSHSALPPKVRPVHYHSRSVAVRPASRSRTRTCSHLVYAVDACRDSKDNMILEVAVNGAAQLIVTGDRDLLSIRTFHGIPIITPSTYLEWSGP